MIFDDKTLGETLEEFRRKHAEMVDCLICRAVESMPWQDIELVITHEADGSTVRVRRKEAVMQKRLEDAESALRLYREAGLIPEYLDPATKYFDKYEWSTREMKGRL